MNISINISVSTKCYTNKNTINWSTLKYERKSICIETFAELIKQGYCFCHCFQTKNQSFGVNEKRYDKFEKADMVFIDIDNSDLEMKDFVNTLSQRPTLYYTTPNNYTSKSGYKYRFRLCYLLNVPITNSQQYQAVYESIVHCISNDIKGFKNEDNCGKSAVQQFSGNGNSSCELYFNENVFSCSDFPFQNNNVSLSSSLLFSNGKKKNTSSTCETIDREITDELFIYDVTHLKAEELIGKYREIYRYFTHTELEFSNGYALIPPEYIEIYRSWQTMERTKPNGSTNVERVVKKLRDGDGRRRKLFIAGLVMRKIAPEITYEHLLYNLLCEKYYYYDDSDRVLTSECMMEIARNVMNIPVNEINLSSKDKRKYIVDKAFCANNGIKPNQMKNIVRKWLKDEVIGNLYDCNMTIAENLEAMKKMGIRIGKSKLYQWCKENHISPKGQKQMFESSRIQQMLITYQMMETTRDEISNSSFAATSRDVPFTLVSALG